VACILAVLAVEELVVAVRGPAALPLLPPVGGVFGVVAFVEENLSKLGLKCKNNLPKFE